MILDIKYKNLTDRSLPLAKAYDSDAGIDLYTSELISILPGEMRMVRTGIAMAIPEGYCGIIKERSGVSISKTIFIKAGVIDSSYRGEIKIVLANHGIEPLYVGKGEKIAQLLILPVPEIRLHPCSELDDTDRGGDGFGSTDTI